MSRIYLSFVEHAVASAAETLRLYRSERRKPEDRRDFAQLAAATHHAYLAIEKLLKHVAASADPYLLLRDPRPQLIQGLRKEMLTQGLPTIFASRRNLDSVNAEEAWLIIRDVLEPAIDSTVRGSFESGLKALAKIRHQCQHGEMYGESEEILTTIEAVFGRLPAISAVACPTFLERLEELRPNQYAELKAIESAVDAAWLALRDQLLRGRRFVFDVAMHVTLRPNIPSIGVSIHRVDSEPSLLGLMTQTKGTSSLLVHTELEPPDARGFFSQLITAAEAIARDEARRQVIRKRLRRQVRAKSGSHEIPQPGLPPEAIPQPLLNLGLGTAATPPVFGRVLEAAFLRNYERERAYIAKYGMPPLEDGILNLDGANGWLSVPSSSRSATHITGDIVLRDFTVRLYRRRPGGVIAGAILPGTTRPSAEPITPIGVDGKVWLTSEVVVEREPTENLPVGSIIRFFRGRVHLRKPTSVTTQNA